MLRTLFKSKIHRATVTQADLHYVGSATVDADLMDAADLPLPGELVHIVDISQRRALETYVIEGERGSVIGINGAAAHLVHPGDLVILIGYAQVDDAEARAFVPRVVHVDAANRIVELGSDASAPVGTDTARSPHAVPAAAADARLPGLPWNCLPGSSPSATTEFETPCRLPCRHLPVGAVGEAATRRHRALVAGRPHAREPIGAAARRPRASARGGARSAGR